MALARRRGFRSPSPAHIPTEAERHEFNAHWFAGPMYERIDALLVAGAQNVGQHSAVDLTVGFRSGDPRVAPFVRGFRRCPLNPSPGVPTIAQPDGEYRQVVRTEKPKPAPPTTDHRLFTCCWCQHFILVDARLVVAWPCYIRCAHCRRLAVWHEQHWRSLRKE